MKKTFWFAILSACALSACQLGAASPSATPAPTSAPTLAATATLAAPPSASQTPPPAAATATSQPTATAASTLTPEAPPTPDPNEGLGDVVYADRLDGLSGWGWGYQEEGVVSFTTAGGQLDAVMSQTNVGPRFSVSADTLKIADQQIRFTARANLCYERDEYGLAFRVNGADSIGNPNGYVLKLTCAGLLRLEMTKAGENTVVADWTGSPAFISGAPAENQILIWATGNEFRVYVNDKFVFSAVDATYAEGSYAFFLRDRTNGGEAVSFAGLEVRAVTRP